MKIKKFGLIFLFVLVIVTSSIHLAFAETSVDRALLIQGDLPWSTNTNIVVLNQLVNSGHYTGYDVKTASDVSSGNFSLSSYKIVIFANDQSQASYNQYSNILKNKLEEYANLGGVVIFGICDRGHNGGTLSATLPGGIQKINSFQSNNYIVDNTNPVVTGKLSNSIALTDLDLVGSYCSHASFVESSLPVGTKIILRGRGDNLPTLVDYQYGSGHIIASGLTWEIGYAYGWSFATKAYDDLLIYALDVANNISTTVTPKTSNVYVNDTIQLTVTVAGVAEQTVTWITSDEAIATVDASTGLVTGVSVGTVTITATSTVDNTKSDTSTITVKNKDQVAPMELLGVATSFYGLSDGKITGVTTEMEYKLSTDTIWIEVLGTEIIGIPAGTYEVRYADKQGYNESDSTPVAVLEGPADLTNYNEALGKVIEADFTEESWTAYKSVVEANKVTETNSQTEVNTATNNITQAQSSLVKIADTNLAAAKASEDLLDASDYVDYSKVTEALLMPEGTDEEKIAKTDSINNAIKELVTKADLTNYNEALGKVTEADYTEESWTAYKSIVEANKVTETNSQTEVNTATNNITQAQSSLVKISDANLEAAKAAEDLLDASDYVDYSKVTEALLMPEGTDEEKTSKTDSINNAIKELVTKADLLATFKTASIAELNAYKMSTDYTEENWALIIIKKSNGEKVINESTISSAVTNALSEAKADIDKVKTIAQEAAEALEESLEKAKSTAKGDLNNELATYTSTDYTEEDWAILIKTKTNGDVAINKATTVLEIETAKKNAIAAMNTVKTIVESINTYSMNGYLILEGTDNGYVEGATVKLLMGNRQIAKTTTDDNGVFRIKYVPKGIYNLVISKDEQTVTLTIEVLNSNVETGSITLPNGKKNSIVDVKDDNYEIVVGNLNDFFNSSQFNDDDRSVVDSGGTVEIKLTVEEKSESDAVNAVKIKIAAGSEKTIGMFIDLTLSKTVTTSSAITSGSAISGTYTIDEIENVLSISIPLPTELQNKIDYIIYRYHGTEVQKITSMKNADGEYIVVSEDGKSITLYTKKFSTYAIAYTSLINNNNDDDDDDDITAVPIITVESNTNGKVTISTNNKTATIEPNKGYVIADVLVDDESVGATSKYTFNDSRLHNICAVFVEESAIPYYMQKDRKVFIGLAVIQDNLLKYTLPNGMIVQFVQNSKSFTDIGSHWAKENIDFVTEREIFVGTGNGVFSPNTGMTRAMFVTAVGRLYERSYGSIKGNTTFSDVDTDAYYANYVAWAHENNIINGIGENKFAPDSEVTREQMSKIMFQFATLLDKAPVGDWMINVTYSDKSEISDWAMDSVLYCQMKNIITGRNDGEFAPKDAATRAEVATVIERFVNEMLK